MISKLTLANLLAGCLLFSFVLGGNQPSAYEPNWPSLDSRPLPKWYDQSKIGIFIHWGVYSVPSFHSEWFWRHWITDKHQDLIDFMAENYRPGFSYPEFAPMFTAEFYNATQWAEIFAASGAKYVVLTSKHHEGYTLWPSKHTFNWNSVDIGPHRDLLGELAAAVRAKDLRFGAYYSLMEWYHPQYMAEKAANWTTRDFPENHTMLALRELVMKYEPEIVWGDGEAEAPTSYWGSEEFLAWLYNDSPVKDTVVVNDRWGEGTQGKHGGFYNFADRYNPGLLIQHKWENAMTIDKRSWGNRRDVKLSEVFTPEELINELVVTVACGGNLLMNVGPTKEGTIPNIMEERLRQMGEWLQVNGEAIYNTVPWIHQNDTVTKDVWYTTTEDKSKIFAMTTKWPGKQLVLGAVNMTIPGQSRVELLGSPGLTMEWEEVTEGGLKIMTPRPDDNSSKWAWTFVIIP